MDHKKFRGNEISKWGASVLAKCLKLFGWVRPSHVQERVGFLNQGCEYLDLELSETDSSKEFNTNSKSAAACFDGAQFGEVHL
jgi:hypothetical protein